MRKPVRALTDKENKRSKERGDLKGSEPMNTEEIRMNQLGRAAGGTVNKNPSAKDPGSIVDITINGENYDALAQVIANKLCPPKPRNRGVINGQDINDVAI